MYNNYCIPSDVPAWHTSPPTHGTLPALGMVGRHDERTRLVPHARRRPWRSVAIAAALGAGSLAVRGRWEPSPAPALVQTQAASKSHGSPHIVISLVDDQGYADVPWTASDGAANAMPFAEKLARDGVILTNYHAAPSCTMSRGMLLTLSLIHI